MTPIPRPPRGNLRLPAKAVRVRLPDASNGVIDWPGWLRLIERKRRLLLRVQTSRRQRIPIAYFAAATFVSFRLDGIEITEAGVAQALARGWGRKRFRPRVDQRIRNHVAILRRIESAVRCGQALKTPEVIRWYTSIGCGLSTANLDDSRLVRLDGVLRGINSPRLRLQQAVCEIARMHAQLIGEALLPSFNGILARLLMQYHLGRCGLPPVLLDPELDRIEHPRETRLTLRLLETINAGCDVLLSSTDGA